MAKISAAELPDETLEEVGVEWTEHARDLVLRGAEYTNAYRLRFALDRLAERGFVLVDESRSSDS